MCVCVLKFCNALGHLISKLTRADLLDEIINRFLCLLLCEFRDYQYITIVLYLEGPCIDLIIPTITTLKMELSIMDQFDL